MDKARTHIRPAETPFLAAIRHMLRDIEATLPASFSGVVACYIVGGAAVHMHVGSRVSDNLDAVFRPPILLRETPTVTYHDGQHGTAGLALDRNYTDVLAMMHPDWEDDAWYWEAIGRLRVLVISPIDLAVSKVVRFADNDVLDISQLAMAGLIAADDFAARCAEAIDYYVGDLTFVRMNVATAADLIRQCTPTPTP